MYIPTETGGYRIFTSRKDLKPQETLSQIPPNATTPTSSHKQRLEENNEFRTVSSTSHTLQTPPRSRPLVANHVTSPSPGVAFMKKPAETDERSLLHCPLCGKSSEVGDYFLSHITQVF